MLPDGLLLRPVGRTDWKAVYASFDEIWSVRLEDHQLRSFSASFDVKKLDRGGDLHKAIPLIPFCLLFQRDSGPLEASELSQIEVTSLSLAAQTPLEPKVFPQLIGKLGGDVPMYELPVSKNGFLRFTLETGGSLAPDGPIHLSLRRCQGGGVKDLAIGEKLDDQVREMVWLVVLSLGGAGVGLLVLHLVRSRAAAGVIG